MSPVPSDPHNFSAGQTADAEQVDARFAPLYAALNGALDATNIAAALQEALVPAGTVLATARSAAPAGYLLCDGSAVSRATHAALFAAIGIAYGAGDGSTTFNLPDLRGRAPVGVDGAAGRLTANDALGQAGGAETHTLTEAQIPPLTKYTSGGTGGEPIHMLAGTRVTSMSGVTIGPETPGSAGITRGQAHNNMPPYQVCTYIIKT